MFLLFSNILTVSGKRRLLSFNFHQVQENMVFKGRFYVLDLTTVHLVLINLSRIAFSGKISFSFPKELVFQNKNKYIRIREELKAFLLCKLYVCFGLVFNQMCIKEKGFLTKILHSALWLKYKILTGIPTSVLSLKTWPVPQQLSPNKPEIKIVGLGT